MTKQRVERVLLCQRVSEIEPPDIQAHIMGCDKCGVAVWVADSSNPKGTPRCFSCTVQFAAGKLKIAKPTKRQMREIREFHPDFDLEKANEVIAKAIKNRGPA